MINAEKALIFQHNKTALALANLNQRARLLTLADSLNLMLTAKLGLANWERKLSRNWANFQHFTILSWHDTKGDFIIHRTSTTNLSVVKPIKDGKKDKCRSAGIKFVQVQLKLDYYDLAMKPAGPLAPNTVLRGKYYIQLPQAAKDLVDKKGAPYRLMTYLSINNILVHSPLRKSNKPSLMLRIRMARTTFSNQASISRRVAPTALESTAS
jgi:hypothetical protein